MSVKPPIWVKPMILCLGLVGVCLNLLVFFDLPGLAPPRSDGQRVVIPFDGPSLREAVFLIKVPGCASAGESQGTAFAVGQGYLVTCAHVVSDAKACGSRVRVVSSYGVDQVVELVGYAEGTDLALLRLAEPRGSVLSLADSTRYESTDEVLRVFTVGYPLVGAASTEERSSISSVGSISHYDRDSNRFITVGLNVNPGNSGGPVLFGSQKLVLGVASAKPGSVVGHGIAYVIPAETVRAFFLEVTGTALE
jgi:S1-C subfamily serine protease